MEAIAAAGLCANMSIISEHPHSSERTSSPFSQHCQPETGKQEKKAHKNGSRVKTETWISRADAVWRKFKT